MEEKESTLLKWSAPEFVKYKRGWKWYVLAIVSYLGVVIYSVYVQDWYIIGIATVLLTLIILSNKKEPKETEYKITQLGVYIDNKLFPFNEFHSFWLILNDEQKVLNLAFRKKYLPLLSIIFYGIDPLQLKTTLTKYLPEQEDRTESITEKLQRYLRLN